jgi:hypothetical protein
VHMEPSRDGRPSPRHEVCTRIFHRVVGDEMYTVLSRDERPFICDRYVYT